MPEVQIPTVQDFPQIQRYPLNFTPDPERVRSFSKTLEDYMYDVNSLQKESAQKVRGLITGETKNLHEVTIAAQKSKIAFDLMLEVRRKLLEGYQEVMRTPI